MCFDHVAAQKLFEHSMPQTDDRINEYAPLVPIDFQEDILADLFFLGVRRKLGRLGGGKGRVRRLRARERSFNRLAVFVVGLSPGGRGKALLVVGIATTRESNQEQRCHGDRTPRMQSAIIHDY